MSRPRKPTKILELTGAFAKDPQRRRAREAEPVPAGPVGVPPVHFTPELKAIWRELIDRVPEGVLTCADEFLLELTAVLLHRFRKASTNPAYPMMAAEIGQLNKCLVQMGLTPADRSKIAVPKVEEKETDEFADLANDRD